MDLELILGLLFVFLISAWAGLEAWHLWATLKADREFISASMEEGLSDYEARARLHELKEMCRKSGMRVPQTGEEYYD